MPLDPQNSPGFLLWHVTLRWQRDIAAALAPLDLTHVQFVLLASTWWLLLAAAALTVVVSAAVAAAYRCSPGAVGGCAQRQLSPTAAASRVGLCAPAVEQARDPRHGRMDGQPGAAGLLVEPAEQRRARPVPGWREPRPVLQLVPGAKQQ